MIAKQNTILSFRKNALLPTRAYKIVYLKQYLIVRGEKITILKATTGTFMMFMLLAHSAVHLGEMHSWEKVRSHLDSCILKNSPVIDEISR